MPALKTSFLRMWGFLTIVYDVLNERISNLLCCSLELFRTIVAQFPWPWYHNVGLFGAFPAVVSPNAGPAK